MALLFLAAFLLRLIGLNQSLWLDEATTAKVVLRYSLLDIPTKFSIFDFHPPFYYLFMKVWTAIFGYNEIALRMPSVLFSLLTGYFVYLSACKIKSRKAGLWAAAFFLFNPLIVYYSQEARMYMMATFLLTAAFYFLFVKRSFLFYIIVSFLAVISFYGSIFFLIGMSAYLFYKKDWKRLVISLLGPVLGLSLLSPLLLVQLANAKKALGLVANWHLVLGGVTIKNLALIPIKFFFGRISFDPKKFYYFLSAIWTCIVGVFVYTGATKKKEIAFFILFPLFLGIIFSIFTPLLQYFRFLYVVPFIAILLSISTENKHIQVLLLAGFAALSLTYVGLSQFHREDWKTLAFNLNRREEIYMIVPSSDALRYYLPSVPVREIRNLSRDTLASHFITIIPYTTEIYGYDYKHVLSVKGYHLSQENTSARGLSYELWVKNSD